MYIYIYMYIYMYIYIYVCIVFHPLYLSSGPSVSENLVSSGESKNFACPICS